MLSDIERLDLDPERVTALVPVVVVTKAAKRSVGPPMSDGKFSRPVDAA